MVTTHLVLLVLAGWAAFAAGHLLSIEYLPAKLLLLAVARVLP